MPTQMEDSSKTLPVLAIVVPCYNESACIAECVRVLCSELTFLSASGLISGKSFILFCDDGSRDGTWGEICRLHNENSCIRGIRLAANRGQQIAILAGLECVADHCDAAVTMDADLQDDPCALSEMLKRFHEGSEIILGVRGSRESDGVFKRVSASVFYGFQKALGLDTVSQHADYRLLSRRAIEMLLEYGERNVFLRGLVPQLGLERSIVEYGRCSRKAGESKYPLKKMMSLALDGITSFSARPMRMIFFTGLLFLLLSVCVAVYVLLSYSSGETVSGWTSLMLSVWFLGSLILMSIGIVGEYIGKIYIETKQRPRYSVRDRLI